MTQASRYRGLPVSEGVAAGQLYTGGSQPGNRAGNRANGQDGARSSIPDEVAAAFAAVVRERSALADRLREVGRSDEADIVAIGALIAADPALVNPAVAAARDGTDAAVAVERSAAAAAAAIAQLGHPDLAARADDVRQVASAVLAHLAGDGIGPPPPGSFILVRRDIDPADLIRFAESGLVGAVSMSGGANSHAAIIARGLGVPMLAGADPAVLAVPAGSPAILDGEAGRLIVHPSRQELAAAGSAARTTAAGADRPPAHARPAAGGTALEPGPPPRTRDNQEITLLCNVASATETRIGLAAGAAGVGLLRTEIPFISTTAWPSEADHRIALEPVLDLLTGRPAVVRLLDFSGDKVPSFLAGQEAGLSALLRHPRAMRDQIRGLLRSGHNVRLSVMVPMVSSPDQVALVRAVLAEAAAEVGADVPPLGIMVELAATASASDQFAQLVDFFSIGTNDLTSQVLGLDRADPRMRPALAADPRVLALISQVVQAAGAAGVSVSVCGDAAADPAVLPLLIGLGVRALSVGAARLPRVAAWIADSDTTACAALAGHALDATSAEQVQAHVKAP
jgi:phosphoenolpyruvate-protein kinase (PTS system EI component)